MILGDTTMFAESLQPLNATVDEAQRTVPMMTQLSVLRALKLNQKAF